MVALKTKVCYFEAKPDTKAEKCDDFQYICLVNYI